MSIAHHPWTDAIPVEILPKPPKRRLTVVESVNHEGTYLTSEKLTFEYALKSDEVAYKRPFAKLGEAWEALDTGYIENPVAVVIKNLSGSRLQTIPTPEERAEINAKVIEVGLNETRFTHIPPGQHLRVNLLPGESYSLRCQKGQAEYSLFVIPH